MTDFQLMEPPTSDRDPNLKHPLAYTRADFRGGVDDPNEGLQFYYFEDLGSRHCERCSLRHWRGVDAVVSPTYPPELRLCVLCAQEFGYIVRPVEDGGIDFDWRPPTCGPAVWMLVGAELTRDSMRAGGDEEGASMCDAVIAELLGGLDAHDRAEYDVYRAFLVKCSDAEAVHRDQA